VILENRCLEYAPASHLPTEILLPMSGELAINAYTKRSIKVIQIPHPLENIVFPMKALKRE